MLPESQGQKKSESLSIRHRNLKPEFNNAAPFSSLMISFRSAGSLPFSRKLPKIVPSYCRYAMAPSKPQTYTSILHRTYRKSSPSSLTFRPPPNRALRALRRGERHTVQDAPRPTPGQLRDLCFTHNAQSAAWRSPRARLLLRVDAGVRGLDRQWGLLGAR